MPLLAVCDYKQAEVQWGRGVWLLPGGAVGVDVCVAMHDDNYGFCR